MGITICDVRNEHLEDIAAIERECFSVPWTVEQLKTQLPDAMHVFLLAEENGEAAGYVGMMNVLDEGYISNVAVREKSRRRGVADALLNALVRRCEERGLVFATLEVRASNAPAIALYAKHGFVPVGERKNYYERPTEDALLMTKFFKRGAES